MDDAGWDGRIRLSRGQSLRRERGQRITHFICSADPKQDWQPYPVDPYSSMSDDHTYIHIYMTVNYPDVHNIEYSTVQW